MFFIWFNTGSAQGIGLVLCNHDEVGGFPKDVGYLPKSQDEDYVWDSVLGKA